MTFDEETAHPHSRCGRSFSHGGPSSPDAAPEEEIVEKTDTEGDLPDPPR